MEETLQCIINTGYYSLSLDKNTGDQLFLHYEPSFTQQTLIIRGGEIVKEKWNNEQIRDFVRRLGFVDKDEAKSGAQIRLFLSLDQVNFC